MLNSAPEATDDAYTTDEDTTLTVDAPHGVLFNDTDSDGDTLTADLVDDVDNGTLTLNQDGSFTYEPDDNYNGSDSFTYKANDGTVQSNEATVTITVNDAPVATDDTKTMNEDGAPITIDLASLVSDEETSDANLPSTRSFSSRYPRSARKDRNAICITAEMPGGISASRLYASRAASNSSGIVTVVLFILPTINW